MIVIAGYDIYSPLLMERMSSDDLYRGFQCDGSCWWVIISENVDKNTLESIFELALSTNILPSCKAFQC